MIVYASRMACAQPDPVKIARSWFDRADDLFSGCLRDRDVLPANQSIDVRFTDFMADEQGTLSAIYDLADQPYGDDVRTAMAGFIAAHPRGRYGEVIYDLADVGLDPAEVAERLGPYRDRFIG
jgi:hypothetical protein